MMAILYLTHKMSVFNEKSLKVYLAQPFFTALEKVVLIYLFHRIFNSKRTTN